MLPFSYAENRLVLLPVDPNTLFAYWDFSSATWDFLTEKDIRNLILVLECGNDVRHFDAPRGGRNFYFRGLQPRRKYRLKLSWRDADTLTPLMQSSFVTTPADRPSENRSTSLRKYKFPEPPKVPGSPESDWHGQLTENIQLMGGEHLPGVRPAGMTAETSDDDQGVPFYHDNYGSTGGSPDININNGSGSGKGISGTWDQGVENE